MDTLNQIVAVAREDLITGEHDSDPGLTSEFPLKFPTQPRSPPSHHLPPHHSYGGILALMQNISFSYVGTFKQNMCLRHFIVHIHVIRNLAFRDSGNSF